MAKKGNRKGRTPKPGPVPADSVSMPEAKLETETQSPETTATRFKKLQAWIKQVFDKLPGGPRWLKGAEYNFAVSMGAVGLKEYLVAEVFLVISLVCGIAQIYVWTVPLTRRASRNCARVFLALVTVGIYTVGGLTINKIRGKEEWSNWLKSDSVLAPPTPTQTQTPEAHAGDTPILDQRTELRNESSKPLRDVAFHIKLKRQYSIQELGHYRILFEVFNGSPSMSTLGFFLACQDLYEVNEFAQDKSKQYGYRCTAHYRPLEARQAKPIPLYARSPRKYVGVLSASPSTDMLEWQIDLYDQVPTYRTLEDLNRKDLYIFVTAPLVDKISEVSFAANNWELISLEPKIVTVQTDKPIVPWFLRLSASEKAVEWRGLYLKQPESVRRQLELMRPLAADTGMVLSLDFGIIHPKKLSEPVSVVDPYRPTQPSP